MKRFLASTAPFPTVLELHRTNPDLPKAGGVSVVLPSGAVVPATWCGV